MDKEKIEEKLAAQIQATTQFYNLWQQSQGAVTMLQELLKEEPKEGED